MTKRYPPPTGSPPPSPPGAADRDRDGAGVVPTEALDLLDSSGLLSITVPGQDGGPGLGARTLAEVARIVAAADPAIAQVPQAHFLLVDLLAVHGSEGQRKRLYAEVLAGRRIGNALAERGGKHAQDLRTRITGGRLNGVKYYTTGALTSAWIGVSALDENGRLVMAFVPRDADGVGVDTDWDVVGQRATISGTATFTDVPVAHTAIEVGIAGDALDDARAYLKDKSRPSTEAVRAGANRAVEDPHVMYRYGRLAAKVRAAEALLESAARTLDEIGLVPADAGAAARGSLAVAVAAAKAFGSEVAVEAGSEVIGLCGTSSAASKYDLDRHWRNARTHSVHDPVDWKYHHIAAYELSGVLPPNHGQL